MKSTGIIVILLLAITNYSISKNIKFKQYQNQDTDYCKNYRIDNNKVYLLDNIVNSADPKTFQCIKYEYAKDNKSVFFGTKKMNGIDPATFTVLDLGYSKDKNYVYYNYYTGQKIKGADPASFVVFDLTMSKDKNHVYTEEKAGGKIHMLKDVDARTFEKYKEIYYIDQKYLYDISGQIIARLDTFDLHNW